MKKIAIFGTGSSAEEFLWKLDLTKLEILYFCDNNETMHYKTFKGIRVIPPTLLKHKELDYLFIASQSSFEIMKQLLEMNFPFNKIIPTDFYVHAESYKYEYDKIVKNIPVKQTFTSKKRKKIALQNYNYANYQGYALYRYLPDFISSKYDVDLLVNNDRQLLSQYDVICSSSFEGVYDNDHTNIEFWHGFPLKTLGLMREANIFESYIRTQKRSSEFTNLIMSYSQFYSSLFNASFPSTMKNYKITGLPRNDLLFEEGSKWKLKQISVKYINSSDNIIFYMPTWRKSESRTDSISKSFDKLFGFEDEDEDEIISFLEKEKIVLVIKLHPLECNKFQNNRLFQHKRVILLTDDVLLKHKIHLYEILPSADILITDYSSVYFDTLLIDTKLIFSPTDLDDYNKNRGFVLEPYTYLTPGPTVKSFYQLKKEVINYQSCDNYKEKREYVRNIVHKYKDGNSSERVWREIDNYLSTL